MSLEQFMSLGPVICLGTISLSLSHERSWAIRTRCILGDIRLWVGDPSSRRVERLFDIFLSCVPPIYEDHLTVFVSQVTGLALGERIYSVRFQGDVGYVVTFRQVMVWGLQGYLARQKHSPSNTLQ